MFLFLKPSLTTSHIWVGEEIVVDRISSVDSADVAVINYIHGIGLISSKHMNCDCGSCGEVDGGKAAVAFG